MFSLQGSFTLFSDVVIGMREGEVGDVVATVVVGAILSDTNGDGGGGRLSPSASQMSGYELGR